MAINGVTKNQLNNFLNTGNESIFNAGKTIQFMNSAWTYYEAYQGAQTEVQRNQIRQNFIQQALPGLLEKGVKLVSKLFGSKEAEATDDVNNTGNKIKEGENEVNEKIEVTEDQVKRALEDVDIRVNTINDLLAEVSDIQDQRMTELVQALEYAKAEIEAQKEILNNADSTDEEKKNAIAEIKNQGEIISGLCTSIDDLYSEITNCQDEVESEEEEINAINNEIDNQVKQGQQEVQQVIAQTTTEVTTDNTKHATKGAAEIVEGEALQAAATGETASGIFTLGLGAAAGAETERRALDLIAAGNTHVSGSGTNTAALTASIEKSNANSAQHTTQQISTVGTYQNMANGIIGDVNTRIGSTITSIGSWAAIATSNEELNTAVSEYEERMNEQEGTKTYYGNGKALYSDDSEAAENELKFQFDTTLFELKEQA